MFGHIYADQYDVLYLDKDYEAECDRLETVFRKSGGIHRILDLGCGTGNHTIRLAKRGYHLIGVDRSESMLAQARAKSLAHAQNGSPASSTFYNGDIRNLELGQTFDAVLMMFAVLGYQLANDDVIAAMRTVHRHLRPGGIFIFDFWYGPSVLTIRPTDKIKVVPTDKGEVVRVASSELNIREQLCTVKYRVWHIAGQRLVGHDEEVHQMRYFFPQELAFYLECSGLTLVDLTAFDNLDEPATADTWNVLGVAKKI
jgi:SAM-dependent methyltransferase